ncbi:hypothetical protein BC332_15977 [Capsicum chinense]|nr:hypothetical protein BC332_15977 [Capsicum chinense]
MNEQGKIHSTFINNDRYVSLYILDVAADGSRPLLRINIVSGSPTILPPQPAIDEHDSFEDECLDAHPMDTEDDSMELEDSIFSEEEEKKPDLCFISDRHKSIANGIVKAYNHDHHSDHFVEFKNNCPETTFLLEHTLGFEKWSRAYFPSNRFNVMTTNIIESVNAMLIDEREYLVTSIFNMIVKRFGEIFMERRAYVLKYKDNKFVPAAKKIL